MKQLAPAHRGEPFGRYLLIRELARSRTAEVFLAVPQGRDRSAGVLALKRIAPQLHNRDCVSMFMREAGLALRLRHPNVVRVDDFGELLGRYFLAMEYVPGETLAGLMQRFADQQDAVPPDVAASIIHTACGGLHCLHELADDEGRPLRVVHGGLTSTNIMMRYDGAVKVMDFCIATTVLGTINEKVAYLAPEQLVNSWVDRRADTFSLNILFWELLTGQPLFLRESSDATVDAVRHAPIVPPSERRAGIPPEIDAIVVRGLSRDVDERFQTAAEMQHALEEAWPGASSQSQEDLGRWMGGIFGQDESEVMTEVEDVRASVPASRSTGIAAPTRLGLRTLLLLLGLIGAAVTGVVVLASSVMDGTVVGLATPAAAQPAQPKASLQVVSVPPSAAIFIDGEPTGKSTPATLEALPADRSFELRVEKRSFVPHREVIKLAQSEAATRSITLSPVRARVRFISIPKRASLIVDGTRCRPDEQLELAPGWHEVAVSLHSGVIKTGRIDVKSGSHILLFDGTSFSEKR